jgi:hypothetical protein
MCRCIDRPGRGDTAVRPTRKRQKLQREGARYGVLLATALGVLFTLTASTARSTAFASPWANYR